MSAREMFKKLGYKQTIQDNVIYYFKEVYIPKKYGYTLFYHINFILNDKELYTSKNLDYKELQAINQQLKELKWLDE